MESLIDANQILNAEIIYNLQNCLKNIKHIPRILSHMTNAHASVNDWKALYKNIATRY